MEIKNLIERFDYSYSVPTNIAIANGNNTDFRSVCNSVDEFQDFYDNLGQEIRQEGLITYELNTNQTKRCVKRHSEWSWEVIPSVNEIETIQGPKGDTGAQGPQGPQGPKGDPGTTSWNDLLDKPLIPDISHLVTASELSNYQPLTDQRLQTTSKTIVEAINELYTLIRENNDSGNGDDGGSDEPSTTNRITVSPSNFQLQVGKTGTLTVSFSQGISNQTLEFMSSSGAIATVTHSSGTTYIVTANGVGKATINFRTTDGKYTANCSVEVTSGSGSGSVTQPNISNASETALTQQYASSHESTPNNSNPPSGSYNWIAKPRINPDGSFPQSTWNAIGHWMTTYKVAGSSYYDNVGLLLQNPKMWVWNTTTRSWDVLSDDFEWGTWYREDFWDDGSGNIAGTTQWEAGVSGNHSKWVKIKQTSETSGRCFHPWGYQKNWRSNSNWANNGQPYIVTKIDFKLIKWNESGADNLDKAKIVVNSGADWWKNVGDVWQPDWSTNRDMAVGKYILATRELKRAWCTNLPSSWSYGLPTD